MPVARRSFLVTAAAKARGRIGSGMGTFSGPGILPDGSYGYFDWYPTGMTTASSAQVDAVPLLSRAWAAPRFAARTEGTPEPKTEVGPRRRATIERSAHGRYVRSHGGSGASGALASGPATPPTAGGPPAQRRCDGRALPAGPSSVRGVER